jgi:predicted esterase YcpF (UPF0227 family)
VIVYLHGFCSSPASHKAQLLKTFMEHRGIGDRFWCEQLPPSPADTVDAVQRAIDSCAVPPTLVGSSLGGFYATWLTEKNGLKAVLINPAVPAHLSLAQFVGAQRNLYTGESFDFTPDHVAQMAALDVPRIAQPQRYWLLVETGDELLDYRQALARYAGARQTVIEGGDHGFRHFGEFLQPILEFAGMPMR